MLYNYVNGVFFSFICSNRNPNIPDDTSLAHWPQYTETDQQYLTLRGAGNQAHAGYHFMNAFNYWTEIFPDLSQTIEGTWKFEYDSSYCYTGSADLVSVQYACTLLVSLLTMMAILV